MTDNTRTKCIVEAALLAADAPLSTADLARLFTPDEKVTHQDLARIVSQLQKDCAGRGVELVQVASGFRYQTRAELKPWISRLWSERPGRYSRALLETLALIAYRQPVTRGEIEQVRGVAVSTQMIRTLEEREWVRIVGYRDVPGKPALLGTTRQFLDYFNLKSLDDMPALDEIRAIADDDLQLPLAPGDGLPVKQPETPSEGITEEDIADEKAISKQPDTIAAHIPAVSMEQDA